MKTYQKLALCIAPFVLTSPSIAQEASTPEPVKEETLVHEYNHYLNTVLGDNLLSHQEIEGLSHTLETGLTNEMDDDYFEKQKLREDAIQEIINIEREKLKNKIISLAESKKSIETIIDQYPGLIDDKAKITYSSEQKLKEPQEELLKQAINSMTSEEVTRLLTEENLYVQDLVFVYNKNKEEISAREQEMANLAAKIRSELGQEDNTLNKLLKQLKLFKDYSKARDAVQKGSIRNDYYSVGLAPLLFIDLVKGKDAYFASRNSLETYLEHYSKKDINPVPFEEEFKQFQNEGWKLVLGALASMLGPILVHTLLKMYRKDTEASEDEVALHILNMLGTGIGLDYLHPWIFPAKFVGLFLYEICKGGSKK